jgi:hypothetical protein
MGRVFLFLLMLSMPAWAVINAASFQRTIEVCGDGSGYRKAQYPDGICSPPDVYWTTDFETGALGASTALGGMGLKTLAISQTNCDFTSVSSGGAGPASGLDARVVDEASNTVGADTNVAARVGTYFFKSSIDIADEYEQLNTTGSTCTDGYNGNPDDKPRVILFSTQNTVDWDEEVWLGFSVYLPSNLEHETGYTGTDSRMEVEFVSIVEDSSRQVFELDWHVYDGTTSDWVARVWTSSASISNTSPVKATSSAARPQTSLPAGCNPVTQVCHSYFKLGDVVTDSDLGRWTDFVIRFRANPYPSGLTCNPATGAMSGSGTCTTLANAQNESFVGGNGILQIWKATGTATPNRDMTLVLDLTDDAVGLVPNTLGQIDVVPRTYKHSWKKNTSNVVGPVEWGLDEWRWGKAVTHGTGYSDVHPTGQAQPE